MRRALATARSALWGAVALSVSGCVLHVHDERAGTDTLYGFGVMRVRSVPPGAGVQAAGVSVETGGLSAVWGADEHGLSLGYARRQRMRVFETAAPLQLDFAARNFWSAEVRVLSGESPVDAVTPADAAPEQGEAMLSTEH